MFLMAGDFRQTLPVIPKGTKADEIKACLKSSYLWPRVKKLKLETNMRVVLRGDISAGNFARKLLDIGNGSIVEDSGDGLIKLNCESNCSSIQEIEERVFPDIVYNYKCSRWLSERAILAPKNVSVDKVNERIVAKIPGAIMIYRSVDAVVDTEEAVQYPMEFLNSLEPPGMPSHLLVLKVGVPILLLRNLDSPRLCNGTRLVVKKMMSHVLEATIITGKHAGEDVFITRIPLRPSNMPFDFKRLQFPVRLSFAMTINKAQGQSLKGVGLNLEEACFSHGQLYVGCSRVGNDTDLHILAQNGRTKNIVYKDLQGSSVNAIW